MATPSKPPPIRPQAPSETATLPPSVPGDAVTLPPPPARSDSETLAPSGPAAADGTAAAVPGYEILRELGRGGMGVVYQARHIKLNRPVALKMILAGSHAGAADLARFQTEAEAIARLRHPNIVQVYEVGEHEGKPFFSLEFCAGGSLEKKLAGTPLPPKEAASLVETLARAMQAAHDQKVIHRDLKPANVLLAEDGTPKITDFGLAKKLDEAGQTQSGAVMGTPSYMAPEQAGGKSSEIGAAADVYALGAILYECLTGRPPFKAATPLDTVLQVVGEEPVPPRQLNARVPRDLETICLKCLCKESGKRYPTAKALAEDLRRFQADEPVLARPAGLGERALKWVKRRPALAALLAVSAVALAAVLGGGTAFSLRLQDQVCETQQARDEADNKATELALQVKATEEARKDAEAGEQKAQQQKEEARFNQYVAQMNLVQRDYEANNITRVRELLQAQIPREPGATDYRGFEWHYWQRMSHREPLVLKGHTNPVSGVAYSPDGRWLASASLDGTVRIWDAANGKELHTLKGHWGPVLGVAFSPDSRRVASSGLDQSVRTWDVASGKGLLALQGNTGMVYGVAFNPDGWRLAAWEQGRVRVWDTASGKELLTINAHTGDVKCAAFSPDGRRLASVAQDAAVRVWDTTSGEQLLSLNGHKGVVTGVAYSPDGRRLVSAGSDKTVRVWDAMTGRELLTLKGHTDGIMSVAYSPDGRWLASAGFDSTVRLWDAATGQELPSLKGHAGEVDGVAYSRDGRRLASAGYDNTVRVWDVAGDTGLFTLQGHTDATLCVAYSPDGHRLASAGKDATVRIWDTATGQQLLTLKGHMSWVQSVAYSPDGSRLASASSDMQGQDSTVRVWDAASGQELLVFRGHTDGVEGVAFSPDGRRLASAGGDSMVRVWDAASGRELLTLKGDPNKVNPGFMGVAFSPDGRRLVAWGGNRMLFGHRTTRVWDAASGQELPPLNGPADEQFFDVAYSRDGRRLASAGALQAVRVWDADTGRELLTLKGHTSTVTGVVFSRDGRRLASAGADATVRVWDAARGQELLTLKGHTGGVEAAAFSPDGLRLASVGADATVRIWEAVPVSPEVAPRRGLVSDVHALFARGLLREEVLVALRQDATLSAADRDFARQVAQTHGEDARALNEAAWNAVKVRDAGKEVCAVALRRAEAAVRLVPEDAGMLTTLGVAQYRLGDYGRALKTLEQAEARNATNGALPENLAFRALASHHLGHKEQAQAVLDRLHEVMKQPRWAKNAEAQEFVREAEQVIGGKAGDKEE